MDKPRQVPRLVQIVQVYFKVVQEGVRRVVLLDHSTVHLTVVIPTMEVVAVASAAIMDTAEVLPTVVVAVVAEAKVTMTVVILSTVEEEGEGEGAMVQRAISELLGLAVAMAKVVTVETNMAAHLAQTALLLLRGLPTHLPPAPSRSLHQASHTAHPPPSHILPPTRLRSI